MNKKKFPLLFVDIETTHLASTTGEIIEIAIIRENEKGQTEHFYSKVKPVHLQTASSRALEINHYTPHEWKDAPTWKEIAPVVAKWLHYGVIVGHNVSFDWNYIDHHLRLAKIEQRISFSKIDTQSLSWEHLPLRGVSMDKIRNFFGWSMDNAHTAMKDANDCRRLFHTLNRAGMLKRLFWRLKYYVQGFRRDDL